MDVRLSSAVIDREPATRLVDGHGRAITYLRLSVTDRCNLRCFYCMRKDVTFLPRSEILTLEEMERVAAAFVRLGVSKLRLTGGEPLVRPGVMGLIERLGSRVASGDLAELTLTTNGTLLARHAVNLAAAGVRRVNVSLDTLDPGVFKLITGGDNLNEVMAGIDAARAAGIAVRANMVAMAGINDIEFDKLIRWCGDRDCDMALIEVMPMGEGAEHYLPLNVVKRYLEQRWTLTAIDDHTGGPARYWRIEETGGRLALITPMSDSFCTNCNRVRVTSIGHLVSCLGQQDGTDLRPVLRGSEADADLEAAILETIAAKPAKHCFAAGSNDLYSRPMWQMGG